MGNLKQNLNQNNTTMKLSLIIAGLALSTQAFNPKRTPESMRGDNTPRFTEDDNGKKVGSDALNYGALEDAGEATKYCLKESQAFDKYCHQYNAKPNKVKYGDFTVGGDCTSWEDDGEPTTESVYCLAQDCMFDYCLWRRDQQLDTCEAFVADWESAVNAATAAADGEDQCVPKRRKQGVCLMTKVDITVGEYTGRNFRRAKTANGFKRPGWGQVYNYNNMHDDLDSNDATEGLFESDVCDLYYEDLAILGDNY